MVLELVALESESDKERSSGGPLDSWDVLDSQLSVQAALKLNLPVGDVSGEAKSTVILREVRWFRTEADDAKNTLSEYGVTIRLTITAWGVGVEGTLTAPLLAAKVQIDSKAVGVSAKMQVLGYKDPEVGKLLPAFSTLSVESYAEYSKASDEIRVYIADHPAAVAPVLLRRGPLQPRLPKSEDAAVLAHAIRSASDGDSLNATLAHLRSSEHRELTEQFYETEFPGLDESKSPSDSDQARMGTLAEIFSD